MGTVKKKAKERPVSLLSERRRSAQPVRAWPPTPLQPPTPSEPSTANLERLTTSSSEETEQEDLKPAVLEVVKVGGKAKKFKNSLKKVWTFQGKIFGLGRHRKQSNDAELSDSLAKKGNADATNTLVGEEGGGLSPRGLKNGETSGETSTSSSESANREKRETQSFDLFFCEGTEEVQYRVVRLAKGLEYKHTFAFPYQGGSIPIDGSYNLSSRFPRIGAVNPQRAAIERGEPAVGHPVWQKKQEFNRPVQEVHSPKTNLELRANYNGRTSTTGPAQQPTKYARERAQTSSQERIFSPRLEHGPNTQEVLGSRHPFVPRRLTNQTPPEFNKIVDRDASHHVVPYLTPLAKENIEGHSKSCRSSASITWAHQIPGQQKGEAVSGPQISGNLGTTGRVRDRIANYQGLSHISEPRNKIAEYNELRIARELPQAPETTQARSRETVNKTATQTARRISPTQVINNPAYRQVGIGGHSRETVDPHAPGSSQPVQRQAGLIGGLSNTTRELPRIPERAPSNLPTKQLGSLPSSQSKVFIREVINADDPRTCPHTHDFCSQPGHRKGANHFPRSAAMANPVEPQGFQPAGSLESPSANPLPPLPLPLRLPTPRGRAVEGSFQFPSRIPQRVRKPSPPSPVPAAASSGRAADSTSTSALASQHPRITITITQQTPSPPVDALVKLPPRVNGNYNYNYKYKTSSSFLG